MELTIEQLKAKVAELEAQLSEYENIPAYRMQRDGKTQKLVMVAAVFKVPKRRGHVFIGSCARYTWTIADILNETTLLGSFTSKELAFAAYIKNAASELAYARDAETRARNSLVALNEEFCQLDKSGPEDLPVVELP